MLDSPLFFLGFLSIFHIIGGVALGNALRGLWKKLRGQGGATSTSLFFLIWGSGFGCMPLIFSSQGPAWLLPIQLVIVIGAITVTAFWEEGLREWAKPLFNDNVALMVFGGVFMGAGLLFGAVFVKEAEEIFFGLMLSGIFGLIGLGIFLFGLFRLLKSF